MNRNYFQTLQIKQAKEQRKWISYCQKVKRHGIKNLYPDIVKPHNPETDGC